MPMARNIIEESQLLVAALERVSERLESGGVPGQLQYPQYAHDPEDLDDPADVLELFGAAVGLDEPERDVVGQDGEEVDDVQRALEERPLARRRPEAKDVLEGEPSDAGRLDVAQMLVVRQVAVLVAVLEGRKGVQGQ